MIWTITIGIFVCQAFALVLSAAAGVAASSKAAFAFWVLLLASALLSGGAHLLHNALWMLQ